MVDALTGAPIRPDDRVPVAVRDSRRPPGLSTIRRVLIRVDAEVLDAVSQACSTASGIPLGQALAECKGFEAAASATVLGGSSWPGWP